MSAWLCSDLHLSVLAIYSIANQLDLIGESDEKLAVRERRLFCELKRENLASLAARYPGNEHCDEPEETWRLDERARFKARELNVVAILKLCHCYAYQACEHRGWADSRAKEQVDAIEAHAVRRLPGYQQAPWGI